MAKISQEFKRNIVHIQHVCWKFYKMKNRQNNSNNLVLIPTKPRSGLRKFCDVILHKCFFQQTCSICTIFLLNSREIFTTKSRFDVTRKSVTSSRIRAINQSLPSHETFDQQLVSPSEYNKTFMAADVGELHRSLLWGLISVWEGHLPMLPAY